MAPSGKELSGGSIPYESLKTRDSFDSDTLTSAGDIHPEKAGLKNAGRAKHRQLLFPALICLFLILMGGILFVGLRIKSNTKPESRSCNCGWNTTEAIANGCKYDAIVAAWLPPHCRDEELEKEFNRMGDGPSGEWLYYSDWDKTELLNMTQVGLLGDNNGLFYVSHGWHVTHCTYVWRRQFRARWTGVQMSKRDDTEAHIEHCQVMYRLRVPWDQLTTSSGVAVLADVVHKHED